MNKCLDRVKTYITNKVNNSENIVNKEEVVNNYISNANRIMNTLFSKEIKFDLEEKEGWGIIYTFKLKDKKVFTNSFNKGKLQVFYYSREYSCKNCRIKF